MDLCQRLSDKLEIFDPLDRQIPNIEDNAIKRKDLLDRLLKMDSVESTKLTTYMSNGVHQILDKLFQNGIKWCNDSLQDHLNKAK